jgi:hypothetical protein
MSSKSVEPGRASGGQFKLRLFTAGFENNSVQARQNLQEFCRERFGEKMCEWEEIDVLENPTVALEEQILVTPTLEIRIGGRETRILIFGSLTDRKRLEAAMPIEE